MDNNQLKGISEKRLLEQKEYLGSEKLINKSTPLVSVCVATYQHVGYIAQTLEGILMQKTTFSVEIIVGEDGSTDGTIEICKKYAEENPDRIRLYLRDRNESLIYDDNKVAVGYCNWIWTLQEARGKYIAICEGDDYWTDPYKLQKQVDFLEKDPDYGLVHTNLMQYWQAADKYVKMRKDVKSGYILDELLFWNKISTLTVLVRHDLIMSAIEEEVILPNFVAMDYPLWLYVSTKSKIHHLEDFTGVYRSLPESASNSWDVVKKRNFDNFIHNIRIKFAKQYDKMDIIMGLLIDFRKNDLSFSFHYNLPDIAKEAYCFLLENHCLSLRDRLLYYGATNKFAKAILKPILSLKTGK